MEFIKIKTEGFDPETLFQELVNLLGIPGEPQRWYLKTAAEREVEVGVIDESLDTSGVADLVTTHCSKASVLQRAKEKKKAKVDEETSSKIREQYSLSEELKLLRTGIKNPADQSFVDYNNAVKNMVATAKTKKNQIDDCAYLDELEALDKKKT